MVQRGEAKLDCDEDCNAHKMKRKKETTKEEELRKQEELKAQQVILYTKRKIPHCMPCFIFFKIFIWRYRETQETLYNKNFQGWK